MAKDNISIAILCWHKKEIVSNLLDIPYLGNIAIEILSFDTFEPILLVQRPCS